MQLSELFKTTYEYEFNKDSYGLYDAQFYAGNGTFQRDLVKVDISGKGPPPSNVWGIEFTRGNSMEVTGQGDELRILSTIIAILKEFIEKEKPTAIYFAADREEASRMKLYDRMAKKLPGFRHVVDADDQGDAGIKTFLAWHNKHFSVNYKPYLLVTPDRLN